MSNYSSEINNMIFSFSRCHSFENCKYEWYLKYLLKDEEGNSIYENEQNFYAKFGEFSHEILEKILKNEMNEKEGFEYYKKNFKKNTSGFDITDPTIDKYYSFGFDYFENLSFDWLKNYKILGIEKECRFEVNGIKFIGYIDLLIENKFNKEIIVIDHKSSEYPLGKKGGILKRKQSDYDAYKKQLYLYSQQVYNDYGIYPKKFAWNYFRNSKWLILPFKYEEYEDTKQWVLRLIKEIHNEENFPPHIDFFYCKNLCGFRNSCDYKMMEK